jgi:hypothetical protein
MDLEPLAAAEEAADALLARAIGQLAAADADEARRLLVRALTLHHDELTELVYRFAEWSDPQPTEGAFAKEAEHTREG